MIDEWHERMVTCIIRYSIVCAYGKRSSAAHYVDTKGFGAPTPGKSLVSFSTA